MLSKRRVCSRIRVPLNDSPRLILTRSEFLPRDMSRGDDLHRPTPSFCRSPLIFSLRGSFDIEITRTKFSKPFSTHAFQRGISTLSHTSQIAFHSLASHFSLFLKRNNKAHVENAWNWRATKHTVRPICEEQFFEKVSSKRPLLKSGSNWNYSHFPTPTTNFPTRGKKPRRHIGQRNRIEWLP